MIEGLKPFPAYKDSGLKWLREVPEHWEIRRNGRLFQQRNETGFGHLPILEVSLKTGVRIRDFNNSKRKQVMADRENYKRAAKGDVAYNMMRLWQGAVGVAPENGLVSPAYVIARPNPGTNSDYYSLLFRTDAYKAEVDNYSRGIVKDRNRLYWDEFKQMPSAYPPPAEQAAIVRFITHVNWRIHQSIRTKQKLITLLEEYNQATIYRAVTRGLDPNVRLKPSGVDWMGDVPAHWEVGKLAHNFRCASGSTPSRGTRGNYEGAVPWVKTGELQDDNIFSTEEHISQQALETYSLRLLPVGTLLVAMYGQGQTRGRTGLLKTEATTNQACFAILPNRRVADPKFLQYWFIAHYDHLRHVSQARNATQPNLNARLLRDLRLTFPAIQEQNDLVEFVEGFSSKTDSVADLFHNEIALLREYRTRLIADVVTGKLDVCEAAVMLPNKLDESEPFDEEASTDDRVEPLNGDFHNGDDET